MTGPWHTAPSTIPPQPAPATPPNKKVVDSFGRPLASWPKRLAAYLIDAGPLFATFIIASFFMDNLLTSQADTLTGEVSSSWAVVAIAGLLLMFGFIFLFMVYEVICHGSERGQTIGKSVMKLQIRDTATGGRLGYPKAFLRVIIQILLGMIPLHLGMLLDGVWPLWDSQLQTLHDKAAGSVVIDLR